MDTYRKYVEWYTHYSGLTGQAWPAIGPFAANGCAAVP